MNIFVISIGGTINQKAVDGKMLVDMHEDSFRASVDSTYTLNFYEFSNVTGANLALENILKLRNLIIKKSSKYDGILLLTGTDSLEEIAFALDLLIDIHIPIVITASMRPSDALGYDGLRNFRDAIQVINYPNSFENGVLVVISDEIHAARYLKKIDSQGLNAFESIPGPIGKIRRGVPQFSYVGLPEMQRHTNLKHSVKQINVPIVPMYLDCDLSFINFDKIDGLVIAGMGTGSLSNSVIDTLSPNITKKIPICISTRCLIGDNYDDYEYKGSLQKYTEKGFVLEGYEGLSPYQARIKLIFHLMENNN